MVSIGLCATGSNAGKRKQTRRERFLAEMEQVVPWSGLVALIEPHSQSQVAAANPIH